MKSNKELQSRHSHTKKKKNYKIILKSYGKGKAKQKCTLEASRSLSGILDLSLNVGFFSLIK